MRNKKIRTIFSSGHAQIVDILFRKGADPEAKTVKKQDSPIHFAASNGI